MKRVAVVIAVLLLVSVAVQADELWKELLPDHAGICLTVSQRGDGEVVYTGSWEAFELGSGAVEVDIWGIEPLAGGLSWGGFGNAETPRYLGLGYDVSIIGQWYERIVIYGKVIEF